MSEKLKSLVKQAIEKLAIDGDSESLLLALNLETELYKNKTFIDYLEETHA